MRLYQRGDTSSRYIPEGSREVADSESDAVAYLSERNGIPYGIGYCGKRAKADWNFRFRSAESRDQHVARFFENRRASLRAKAEWRAKEKASVDDDGYFPPARVARMIKQRLAREFPNARFSVTSDSYSGGSSIDIRWSDGPTEKQVRAISDAYSSRGFDGMIDMAYHYDHWLLPNGDVVCAGTSGTEGSRGTVAAWQVDKPHPDAKKVHLSSGYVFCHREVSDGAKAKLWEAWRAMSCDERFALFSKLDPHHGMWNPPNSWDFNDTELSFLDDGQRAHFWWRIASQLPL